MEGREEGGERSQKGRGDGKKKLDLSRTPRKTRPRQAKIKMTGKLTRQDKTRKEERNRRREYTDTTQDNDYKTRQQSQDKTTITRQETSFQSKDITQNAQTE